MSGTYDGLHSPDTNQAALNAAEIIAEVKAKSGKFRELPENRRTCDCTPSPNTVTKVFVGEDSRGVVRMWLWVPAVKTGSGRPGSPPLSVAIPQNPGDPIVPLTAICPRCKSGSVLIPGLDGLGTIRVVDLEPPTYGVVEG